MVEKNVESEYAPNYKLQTDMTVGECCAELEISRRTWYNRVAEVNP